METGLDVDLNRYIGPLTEHRLSKGRQVGRMYHPTMTWSRDTFASSPSPSRCARGGTASIRYYRVLIF